MRRQEQDRLLKDLLAGEKLAELRRASLARGIGAVRRRRRRQAIGSGSLLVLSVLLILAVLRWPGAASRPAGHARLDPGTAGPLPASVEFISDEELFALFPGQPMVLIGAPGQQQLVWLGPADDSGAPL